MMEKGKKRSMIELARPSVADYNLSQKLPIIVVLDNVRSLHNVGSVFRTGDAFAVESIHLCGITATPPNREIQKTALGATDSVHWNYSPTTVEAIRIMKEEGVVIIAAEQVSGSCSLEAFTPKVNSRYAIIFGNEVNGISDEVLQLCDQFIEIPQLGTKHSLNVAVSAGIVLWEFFKALRHSN